MKYASRSFGDNSEEVTPVPIPNTVVKLFSAEGTWRATARENMSSPEFKKGLSIGSSLFLYDEYILCMTVILVMDTFFEYHG